MSPSSSSSTSMKLKTLIHQLIASPVYRFFRALSKAKSILQEASRHSSKRRLIMFYSKKASKKQQKIVFGSFRLHYDWCSSHVVPVPVVPVAHEPSELRLFRDYDSAFNSIFASDAYPQYCCEGGSEGVTMNRGEDPQSELSGYLEWLEEKVSDDHNGENDDYDDDNNDFGYENGSGERDHTDDIDHLADMFIASCHEKFLLEKVESYRRFQEMLARGL